MKFQEGSAARALHTLRLRAITGSKSAEGFTPLAPWHFRVVYGWMNIEVVHEAFKREDFLNPSQNPKTSKTWKSYFTVLGIGDCWKIFSKDLGFQLVTT